MAHVFVFAFKRFGNMHVRQAGAKFGRIVLVNRQIAHIGDFERVRHEFGIIRKKGSHFPLAFKIPLGSAVPHRLVRFGKLCLKADAAQHVLRFGVFFHAIVYVVRQHRRYIELFCERDETRGDALLLFDSVILHFDIVAVGAEKFGIAPRGFFRMRFVSVEQRLRHFALQTGRQTDKPFVIFFEQFEIDTRFIVKAFRVGDT